MSPRPVLRLVWRPAILWGVACAAMAVLLTTVTSMRFRAI
jgi:hypothetical protein